MVSNALSKRLRLSRPPVACVSKPGVPSDPLTFDVWLDKTTLAPEESTPLHVYGDHPYYDKGVAYSIEWESGDGAVAPEPPSIDEQEGVGAYTAGPYPGESELKAMATWPNGTQLFRFLTVTVVEP